MAKAAGRRSLQRHALIRWPAWTALALAARTLLIMSATMRQKSVVHCLPPSLMVDGPNDTREMVSCGGFLG